jgi:hypothetical protein
MTPPQRAVGTFAGREQTEIALERLRAARFDMNAITVISAQPQPDEQIEGVPVEKPEGNTADTGAKAGGVAGSLTGLLIGIGAVASPGLGPVLSVGTLGTALATTLGGGAVGAVAGSLVGSLVGLGIPAERAEQYRATVEGGGTLVLVDGPLEEVYRAEKILLAQGVENYERFPVAQP